jgi:hypothetical protein
VDGRAAVLHAVADHRPSIVAAAHDHVELVAALGAVLRGPQLTRLRVEGEALQAAVSVAPDLGERAGATDERVIRRYAPVVVQADDLTLMKRKILSGMLFARHRERIDGAVRDRDEQIAVGVERQPRPVVRLARAPRARLEDLLHALEPVALQSPSDHGRGALRAVGARLRVAEVDQAVGGEARMYGDVEQSALAAVADRRNARDGLGLEGPAPHHAKTAGALGHEHFAAGQPRHGPGILERRHHRAHPIGAALRAERGVLSEEGHRQSAQRQRQTQRQT